ncbi:LytTR family DNA-binding domain-containing protein [Sphingomonas parapaucimobilis]|uniref:HTH LytTR-type domain-containing protein n=1 Tax=Sphingomonas parapaucimobilis NBRC 15100 TaxID=1219049 RepID=A0A0A1W6G0_9SPHN|nr:LytTR family DNA-binding domain-containing protein [Sphingomonas parapaucimobilis]GAM00494.1 hypothetical protein SP5_034_00670 [Sphingomonas parapaucimobilis NBRC 15100]
MGSPVGNRVWLAAVVAVKEGVIRSPFLASTRRRLAIPAVRWIGLAIVAGVILAILGPFGSYMNGGLVELLSYWIGAMVLGLALYGTAYRLVGRSTVTGSRRWWLALIAAVLLASLAEALATRMAAFWLWPKLARLGPSFPLWFAQTATIGVIATAAIGFALRRSVPISHESASQPSIDPIVNPLGGEVLALQMEDHYVRVHRPAGSELILMPLGRAIEAVDADGLRTHRSWWVAAHAVAAVEGNARAMRLRLSNGLVAPVARSAVTHLKAAGWIEDTTGTIA